VSTNLWVGLDLNLWYYIPGLVDLIRGTDLLDKCSLSLAIFCGLAGSDILVDDKGAVLDSRRESANDESSALLLMK
jgi:hypothetical protein